MIGLYCELRDHKACDDVDCDCICHALAEPTKQRVGDQPLPTTNDHPVIQTLVETDIKARIAIGIQRYGSALQPHNGRDALKDAYEEAMDLTMYLRQVLYERDGK